MEFISKEDFDKMNKEQQEALMAQVKKIRDDQLLLKKEEDNLPKLSMKELETVCKGVMENLLKGMTKTDKKYFALPGIGNDPKLMDNLTPEGKGMKFKMFCRALIGGDRKSTRLNSSHSQ